MGKTRGHFQGMKMSWEHFTQGQAQSGQKWEALAEAAEIGRGGKRDSEKLDRKVLDDPDNRV